MKSDYEILFPVEEEEEESVSLFPMEEDVTLFPIVYAILIYMIFLSFVVTVIPECK